MKSLFFFSFVMLIFYSTSNTPPESIISVYNLNNEIEIYSPGELFSDSAIVRSQRILDTISEKSNQNFRLLFGVTFLKPFAVEDTFFQDSLLVSIEGYSPQQTINDSIGNVMDLYNEDLLNRFITDTPDFNALEEILIIHNVFVYPLPNNKINCVIYIGYHTNVMDFSTDIFNDFETCGELDPTAEISSNDFYLINFVNQLFTSGQFYNDKHINDRNLSLLDFQNDSIGLMIDTIRDERDWTVVVDIVSSQCEIEIDTISLLDTIQIVLEIDDSDQSNDYEFNVYVSTNLTANLPERFRTFVIDSVATPLLDNDSLYRAVINSIERFRRPLPGDPFFDMRVVHPSNANTIGGFYGCTRTQTNPNCNNYAGGNLPTYSGFTRNKGHAGVDLKAITGTDIFSMFDGEVIYTLGTIASDSPGGSGYGNKIRIEHTWRQYGGQNGDPNIITYYTHLDIVDVSTNDQVKQGQKIGESGSTGNASGIADIRHHSHINVYNTSVNNASLIDPNNYFFTNFD